ncbi:A-kinase anchor protein 14 [Sarotherodon galilaeus]
MIITLHNKGLKQREISSALNSYGHKISERHLRRVLKLLGLKQRCPKRPFTEIHKAVEFSGMWIHLGIDGFSRKVLWLKVGTSNHKQSFMERYFYETVQEQGGCPQMIQRDRGKENLVAGGISHARSIERRHGGASEWGHQCTTTSLNVSTKRTWIKKWLTTFE